ncbi:MAG: hypothetical protein LBK95_01175 [Bifidobacteriaceae bacterium]|jgi:hypothetical protein|nr:hypothetical protein [Bifidobacteriaceae bacterium]
MTTDCRHTRPQIPCARHKAKLKCALAALAAVALMAGMAAACTTPGADPGPSASRSPQPAPSVANTEMGAAFVQLYEALLSVGWSGHGGRAFCTDEWKGGGSVGYLAQDDRIEVKVGGENAIKQLSAPFREALRGREARLMIEAGSSFDPDEPAGIVDVLVATEFSSLDLATDVTGHRATGTSVLEIPNLVSLRADSISPEDWPDSAMPSLVDLTYAEKPDFAVIAESFPNLRSLAIGRWYTDGFDWEDRDQLHLESLSALSRLESLSLADEQVDVRKEFVPTIVREIPTALMLRQIKATLPGLQRLNGRDFEDFRVMDFIDQPVTPKLFSECAVALRHEGASYPEASGVPAVDGPVLVTGNSPVAVSDAIPSEVQTQSLDLLRYIISAQLVEGNVIGAYSNGGPASQGITQVEIIDLADQVRWLEVVSVTSPPATCEVGAGSHRGCTGGFDIDDAIDYINSVLA